MGEGPATVRVRRRKTRYYAAIAAAVVLGTGVAVGTTVSGANAAPNTAGHRSPCPGRARPAPGRSRRQAATPIKHLVVLFDENVSFDHYFGTYPYAANTDGTKFQAKARHPDGERPVHQDHPEWPGRAAADQQPERATTRSGSPTPRR